MFWGLAGRAETFQVFVSDSNSHSKATLSEQELQRSPCCGGHTCLGFEFPQPSNAEHELQRSHEAPAAGDIRKVESQLPDVNKHTE